MSPSEQRPDRQARFEPLSQHVENIPLRRHLIGHVETYDVTAQELRSIETESLDVAHDFHFALNTASVAVTLLISLLLTDIPSTKVFASFVAATIVMAVLSLFFFLSYFRKRRTIRSTIQEIRTRQIGPVGEQGRELRPAELASLPASEPPQPEQEAPK